MQQIVPKILILALVGGQLENCLADNSFLLKKKDTLKTITVIDYQTNEPLLGGSIVVQNKEITRADRNGRFSITWDKNADVRLKFLGFHSVDVKTTDLLTIDSIFLFANVHKFKRRKRVIFKKSQYIIKNQVIIQRNNVTYNYKYYRRDKTLKLEIKNAR